jgi:hypothetical protein
MTFTIDYGKTDEQVMKTLFAALHIRYWPKADMSFALHI